MKVEQMERLPYSRASFERNLNLLGEMIKSKRLHFNRGIRLDGIYKVRRLPNGRIDFNSVDEVVRLQANMMANMEHTMPGRPDT